ncbi:MAG: hypothetical protein IPK63_10745 [Candidatus Competibacteraceae bacterium]|nr:hypothetical protein [Candidatus Competibacteraceae bacterium]
MEKIALLFRSHNEHYLVFPRLLSIGILKIAGEINFVWLNILGCLALLVYPYVVWVSVHVPNSKRLLLLLCVCLMIFHPLYVEATLWATAAVSNLWVVGFVLLSFLYAQKNGFYFTFLTFFYGLMATFTLGSGVLAFVILGLIFLNSERYIKGVFSLVLFGILICVMQANSAKAVINKSELGLFDFTLRALDYWITFLGSSLSFYSHSMGLVSGVVFILFFLLLCYLRYDKTNPAVFGLLLFCIFTALVQSLSRSQMNLDFSYTTNRYKIISILAPRPGPALFSKF